MAVNKRLPQDLQLFKREMKEADFEDKMKKYFYLSPVIDSKAGLKKEIIVNLLTPGEKDRFYRLYYPIRIAIKENEEKLRKIMSVADASFFLANSLLRIGTAYSYFGDMAEKILKLEEEGKAGGNKEVISTLKGLRSITPGFNFGYNKRTKKFCFKDHYFLDTVRIELQNQRRAIALLKGYYNALREFLKMAKKEQLFPEEFKKDEALLMSRYRNYGIESNATSDKELNKAGGEVISLDYNEVEPEDFSKEKNPWLRAYNSSII